VTVKECKEAVSSQLPNQFTTVLPPRRSGFWHLHPQGLGWEPGLLGLREEDWGLDPWV
jgi:hypothetical protein